jgi:hypothetical protein
MHAGAGAGAEFRAVYNFMRFRIIASLYIIARYITVWEVALNFL